MTADDAALSDVEMMRCRRMICVVAASSGFMWQSYVPTLALLVSDDFGKDITWVGWLYLAFVGTSIIGSMSLHQHLRCLTPYTLLILGYSLRGISGAMHGFGALMHNSASLPLLILSRVVHGYTILLFPLSVVWIGAREAADNRQSALAERNAFSTIGIFLGIVVGGSLSAVLPTSLQAGAAPGFLNIITSLAMILWLRVGFADRAMIPMKPKGGGGDEDEYVPWLHINLVGFSQFFGWVGFVAIEGSLSLIVVHSYGFSHRDVLAVWAPTSAAMLGGTFLFSRLHRAKWSAWSIAVFGVVALPIGVVSLFFGTVRGMLGASRYYSESSLMVVLFALGLGSLLFAFAITNTLFNGLLMQHLQPHQQARFQTPVQTLAAVGRGIGPFMGTVLMQTGDQRHPGLGAPLMLAFAFTAIAMSILVPFAFGSRFFDPPPPKTMW